MGIRDVTVGDLLTLQARAVPDGAALHYESGPRYSFSELEREACDVARGLMVLGVASGERVVLWASNVPEWVVLQFALAKIGAILVTANTALRAGDIDYLLRQSEAATLITIRGVRDVDYLECLDAIGVWRGALPCLKRVVFIGDDPPPGATPYAELPRMASRVDAPALGERVRAVRVDDVINMQYTSGTTGFPKGVMLSSRNIVNNGHALGAALGYTPADRLCLAVPLFHCFGCVIGVLGAYTHGACLCPVEVFDPRRVLATIEREQCTAVYGVPTMFLAELEHPEFSSFDLRSLRTGVMAGSLCPEPLMRRVMSDMHMPEITIAYGLTEASPGITLTPRDASIDERTQSVGRVLPDLEVCIADPVTGEPQPHGQPGELRVRGYNVMKGYYNNTEATRAAIDDEGWLRTGDEAAIDDEGIVRITGRIKDLIIRGGENISPKEIEDCLRGHQDVADAQVYGLPDGFFGEVVAAALRLRVGAEALSEQHVVEWCTARLARFKVPKHIWFVSEYPLTASGKVQKYKLRDAHQTRLTSHGALFSGDSIER